MNKTSISYLTHTFNPIAMSCTPVSPGCANCWAQGYMRRFAANPAFSDAERAAYAGGDPVLVVDRLNEPLRVRKPAVIGVQFMGDLFHERVPFEMILRVFSAMNRAKQHLFLSLTKRPHRMIEFCANYGLSPMFPGGPTGSGEIWPSNVWPGVTVCNQEEADRLIPLLLQIPAAHHWVSLEPMLEAVDFAKIPAINGHGFGGYYNALSGQWNPGGMDGIGNCGPKISFVALGGETGPRARPLHPDWVRSVRDHCEEAAVSFHFKSWGEWAPSPDGGLPDDLPSSAGHYFQSPTPPGKVWRFGHKQSGHLLDGREHREMPR